MSFAMSQGARIYWRLDGRADRPVIVLVNSLGTELAMWDPVVPLLQDAYRVLRLDTRGHGASDTTPGDYSLALLGSDVLAVMDAAGVAKAALCGLSLGGMIGQWLALNHADRLTHLVLCNTSPGMPAAPWAERARLVREKGMAGIVDLVMERFFSPRFRASGSPLFDATRAAFLRLDPEGYAACCAAIRDMDIADKIGAIRLPTLVINGREDAATPPSGHGDVIAHAIPGARSVMLEAGHISALETPRAFAAALRGFLAGRHDAALGAARGVLFEAGLVNRRRVLGDAWVDKSLASRNAFNGEFQELITRFAWNEIWGRAGLDDRTRRLLVLAITIALGRWEEFRLHVRAGVEQSGFSVEDLKEVIMQSAIYAGVPAANTAFHHADDLLRALKRGPYQE